MPQENSPQGRGLSPRRNGPGPLSGKKGKSILLAIGIDHYQNIGNLHNAVRDVDYLIEVLTRRYQFEKKSVTRIINEEATLGNISREFYRLVKEARPEDEVLVYFSGHGAYDQDIKRGYWIPYDGKLGETHTLFSNGTLVDFVSSIGSRHVMLIVDSCFSGAFFGGVRKFTLPERLASIPSRWVLTSGRNEVVSDGAPGENSPFAESLIYHLNANKNGNFRITELFPRIIEQVGTNTGQLPQCEPIRNVGHKGGEFIFRLKGGDSEPLALPESYQSKPATPHPRPVISPGRRLKITVAIAAALITFLAVWRIVYLQKSHSAEAPPAYRKALYEEIFPMPERGFIVSRNDSFGYADADTLDWIPLQFQETHPFTGTLARVKKGGKYGWIDTAGRTAIDFLYERAGDFQGDSARVALDGRSFLINRKGQEIAKNQEPPEPEASDRAQVNRPEKEEPAAAPPRLSADKVEVGLGSREKGASPGFNLTLSNTGGRTATNLIVTTSTGVENQSVSRFNLGAGQSKTLHFRLNTGNLPSGNFNGFIRVDGGNTSENVYVPVSAIIEQPPPQPETAPKMEARCNLGLPNCQVSFYDKLQMKTVEFTTDSQGYARYSIAQGLLNEPVEVNYCNGSGPLRVRVKDNGCIVLPQ